MPVFYLEASALVKRYRTEPGTDVVNALFAGKSATDVFVSSQLIAVEVESVAGRALKAGGLKQTGYGIMLESFAEDLGTMVVIPLSPGLASEAVQVARQYRLRALDALHFATRSGRAERRRRRSFLWRATTTS